LESIQWRAVKLIIGNDSEPVAGLQSAMNEFMSRAERRDELTKRFYDSLLQPSSCLHHLLPPKRNYQYLVVSKLRHVKHYFMKLLKRSGAGIDDMLHFLKQLYVLYKSRHARFGTTV